jgi:hypothetical protein
MRTQELPLPIQIRNNMGIVRRFSGTSMKNANLTVQYLVLSKKVVFARISERKTTRTKNEAPLCNGFQFI